MSHSKVFPLTIVALAAILLIPTCEAVRKFHRRRDDTANTPISDIEWTVPLSSGLVCQSQNCISSLPAPSADQSLKILTIARGVMTYDCISALGDEPGYVSQYTELYDAAPLIPFFPNEESFHEIVPQFFQYNYTDLTNSSLSCIGHIGTQFGETIVTITGIQEFAIEIDTAIPASNNPDDRSYWSHSETQDDEWEVYRVETAGGQIPVDCVGLNGNFDIPYAAEYWFYHA